jgi:hypothetical protein
MLDHCTHTPSGQQAYLTKWRERLLSGRRKQHGLCMQTNLDSGVHVFHLSPDPPPDKFAGPYARMCAESGTDSVITCRSPVTTVHTHLFTQAHGFSRKKIINTVLKPPQSPDVFLFGMYCSGTLEVWRSIPRSSSIRCFSRTGTKRIFT